MNRLNRRKERLLNEIAERVAVKLIKENDIDDLIGPYTNTSRFMTNPDKAIDAWMETAQEMPEEEIAEKAFELAEKLADAYGNPGLAKDIQEVLEAYAYGDIHENEFMSEMNGFAGYDRTRDDYDM